MNAKNEANAKKPFVPFSSVDHMDMFALRPERYDSPFPAVVGTHSRLQYGALAGLAQSYIEKWGMVAGVEDGEDSAGRAKLRLATPDEVVKRAFDCAASYHEEAKRRGWITEIPSMAELTSMVQDQENTNG